MNQATALRRPTPTADLDQALAQVEQELVEQIGLVPTMLRQVVESALKAGGKRMRPQMVLAAASACGLAPEAMHESRRFGVALEYLHTATLLHDDLVDGAAMRRGEPTAHRRYGPKEAVLGGDLLLARCLSLVSDTPQRDAIGVLARATERMAIGEALELELSHRADATESDYYAFASAKTAALFAAAGELGAIAAEAPLEQREALGRFGEHLGLAFQVADDILDVAAPPEQSGKDRGTDLRAGIPTLPVIKAIERLAGKDEAQRIKQVLSGEGLEDPTTAVARHAEALALVREHGVSPAIELAHQLVDKARRELDAFPPSPALDLLHRMAEQAAERLA